MLKQSSLLQAPVSPFRTFNIWLEDSCLEELVEQAGAWTSELDSCLSSATDFLCDFNFLICSLKKKKKGSLVSKTSFGTFFLVVVWFFVLFLCFFTVLVM